jgi:type II secretory pathway component PulK
MRRRTALAMTSVPHATFAGRPQGPSVAPDRGFALILVLILTILLYVMIAELVTTARMARFTGENDALLARMRNHQRYTLAQVEEMLVDDQAQSEGDGGGGGALGGAMAGGAGAGGAGGDGGGEEEQDLAGTADGSHDAWYEPQGYADNDLTTYVWVEDENRKFNVYSLVSSDDEFARESKVRFVRLIDYLRDDSQYDLSSSDGERLANQLTEWMRGAGRTQQMPKPPLKSDGTKGGEISLPLHLDEIRMFEGVTDELFYDQVVDNRLIPGLESVLTVWTAWTFDPGDPDKRRTPTGGTQGNAGGNNANAGQAGGNRSGATGGASPGAGANSQQEEDPEPIGEGIRININTATRPVLRCLLGEDLSPALIEAILRYRNEELPEQESDDGSALVSESTGPKRKMFAEVQDLDKIPEFMNMANPGLKEKLYELTTTRSHVFTIHMASLFKRNEERRVFVMRRCASVMVRVEDGEDLKLHPITRLEERAGLRVMPVDFLEKYLEDARNRDDVDQFARGERDWNPFFLEFYKPKDQR